MKASELKIGRCYKSKMSLFVIDKLEDDGRGKIVVIPGVIWHFSMLYGILPSKPKKEVYDKDAETDFEEFPMDSFKQIISIQEKSEEKIKKIRSLAETACFSIFDNK